MYKAGNTVNCNMVRGTNSPAVQKLQHSMNLCYSESLVEDGDFGGKTRDALIRTQRRAGTAAVWTVVQIPRIGTLNTA